MKSNVTFVLILASLAAAIWIVVSPSAGKLHYSFTHYDQHSLVVQGIFTVVCVIISFAGGRMFRRR